jgi:hypothetical protein
MATPAGRKRARTRGADGKQTGTGLALQNSPVFSNGRLDGEDKAL